tara:strand:+ start:74 stop:706 length:633 start_codon:yes stop_codon:yes gene_type:complete
MSDILRQIDEDLQKDRLLAIWKRYGIAIIAIIVLSITFVVGFQIYKSLNKNKNEKIVESYIEFSTINENSLLIEKLGSIRNTDHKMIAGLSRINIANALLEEGNENEAFLKLEEIINNDDSDPVIYDLAIYYYLLSKIDKINEDEFSTFIEKAKHNNSPFKVLFQELDAIKYALSGDKDMSVQILKKIIESDETSNEIKIRSEKFLEIIK